jgi:hypothetical protein
LIQSCEARLENAPRLLPDLFRDWRQQIRLGDRGVVVSEGQPAVFAQVTFELRADFWNRSAEATAPPILKGEVFPCDISSALWICCTHPRSAMRRLTSDVAPDAVLEGALIMVDIYADRRAVSSS